MTTSTLRRITLFTASLTCALSAQNPFIVTTSHDEDDGGLGIGAGDSLRECLSEANSAPGPDTIQFDPGLDGVTIVLAGTQLEITSEVTIRTDSLPSGVSVSAAGQASRVFLLGSGAMAVFEGLTIRDGSDSLGAGIRIMNGTCLTL